MVARVPPPISIHFLEDRASTAAQEGLANHLSQLLRTLSLTGLPNGFGSIWTSDDCLKMQSAIDHFRQGSDWNLAAASHGIQQSALAGGSRTSCLVIQKGDLLVYAGIILPDF